MTGGLTYGFFLRLSFDSLEYLRMLPRQTNCPMGGVRPGLGDADSGKPVGNGFRQFPRDPRVAQQDAAVQHERELWAAAAGLHPTVDGRDHFQKTGYRFFDNLCRGPVPFIFRQGDQAGQPGDVLLGMAHVVDIPHQLRGTGYPQMPEQGAAQGGLRPPAVLCLHHRGSDVPADGIGAALVVDEMPEASGPVSFPSALGLPQADGP